MISTTFIYALCEPGTRTVRYIGKADNPTKRFSKHISQSKRDNAHKNRWLRALLALGQRPEIVILSETSSRDWQVEETRYIAAARSLGIRLTNSTDGGEGCAGYVPSLETRVKLKLANIGKIMPAKTREKISRSTRGRPKSEKARANISAGKMGSHPSAETCKKISIAKLGKKHSAESRANMSAANRGEKNGFFGKQHSGESRKRMSDSHKGTCQTAESRAKRSHTMKALWAKRKAAAETGNPS